MAKADIIRDQKTKNDLQKEYLDLNQQVLDNLVEQSDQLTFADKLLNKMFRTESKIDKLAQDKKDAEGDLSEEKLKQKR